LVTAGFYQNNATLGRTENKAFGNQAVVYVFVGSYFFGVTTMNARVFQAAVVALILGVCQSSYGISINFQQGVSPSAGYQANIASLNQTSPDANGAAGTSNFIGHAGTTGTGTGSFRSLEAFDISAIPAGSTINSVTLTLYGRGAATAGASSTSYTIEIHELIGTSTETGVTWNNRFDAAPAGAGGADVPWTTAGGDFSPTVLSSLSAAPSGVTLGSAYLFSSSAAFVAAAQGALDGIGTLYLLGLAPVGEVATVETRFNFGSDDFATASIRPLLSLDYTAPVPEPNSVFLLGFGMTAFAAFKRRMRKCVVAA
jgi:hypothetical protein